MLDAATPPAEVRLICEGAGATTNSSSAYVEGDVSATVNSYSRGQVPAAVQFRIIGEAVSVQVPPSMLPPVGRGNTGWRETQDVRMTDDEVTGRFSVNFANRAAFRLDRVTGAVSMSGLFGFGFTGQCRPVAQTQRLF